MYKFIITIFLDIHFKCEAKYTLRLKLNVSFEIKFKNLSDEMLFIFLAHAIVEHCCFNKIINFIH